MIFCPRLSFLTLRLPSPVISSFSLSAFDFFFQFLGSLVSPSIHVSCLQTFALFLVAVCFLEALAFHLLYLGYKNFPRVVRGDGAVVLPTRQGLLQEGLN